MRVLVLLVLLTSCADLNCSPSLTPLLIPATESAKAKPDGFIISIKCVN